ncbi:MAG: ABC transporter permease [Anaerolineae bacterium]|nr:ABC transporter permease [Anaerolineae bacterium]
MAEVASVHSKALDGTAIRQAISQLLVRYGIVLVLVVLVAGMTILSPLLRDGQQLFLTPRNLIQVTLQASINMILAVGMTFVITSGGIDLSIGSIVALCGVLSAMAMRDLDIGPWAGFALALLIGAACGFINGLLITQLRLPPFIVTLGTLGIFRGAALIISDGRSVYGFDRSFQEIFSARLPISADLELPVAVLIAAVIGTLAWVVLTKTRFGKYTVAIGGSEETTRLAGVPVQRYKLGIYTLCGLLAGVAGALLLARLRSGDPTFGTGFELNAIAATVMGGTSLSGGSGTILGTLVGSLIISVVQNAMNLFNVQSYWQQLIVGAVILFAVILDQWRRRQSR